MENNLNQISIETKLVNLQELLQSLNSAVVAFSSGVDSAFLAAVAKQVLGDKAAAVTASSATLPAWERQDADNFAQLIGIQHVILPVSELESPEFVENTPQRCYHCKRW